MRKTIPNNHAKLQKDYTNSLEMLERKEKRKRRTALEIERKYRCKINGCPKSYGSEGSLNQHMKNKHIEYYQQYIEALNLTGGLIENSDEYSSASSFTDETPSIKVDRSAGLVKRNHPEAVGASKNSTEHPQKEVNSH